MQSAWRTIHVGTRRRVVARGCASRARRCAVRRTHAAHGHARAGSGAWGRDGASPELRRTRNTSADWARGHVTRLLEKLHQRSKSWGDGVCQAERYETISPYVDPNIVKMALLAHDAAERKSTSCEQERLRAARAAIAIFKGNS